MEYTIKAYSELCELETFTINNIEANYDDFGEKYDCDRDNAADYACGNMKFFPRPATGEILSLYKISTDEYNIITEELRDKLSFGSCGWCV